ncbi:unnamed protein product [Protopolystoma xenopodis]|uniref:Uncharacterized protein n=1 Tax=Protopolystoma xenopodis TaxID=117903 RepID=A0A3S5BUF5_9PLAT|nr:unnamed protein product [Protopolystoma xenopodis]
MGRDGTKAACTCAVGQWAKSRALVGPAAYSFQRGGLGTHLSKRKCRRVPASLWVHVCERKVGWEEEE